MDELFPPSNQISDSLSAFGSPSKTEEKQSKLEEVSRAKQALLSGKQDQYRLLATAIEENRPMADDPQIQELQGMTPGHVALKYGVETAEGLRGVEAEQYNIRQLGMQNRHGSEIASDYGRGVGAGIAQSLGGIAALGAGLVNRQAGEFVAEGTQNVSNYIREGQSDPLTKQRDQSAYRAELDRMEIADLYEQDLENEASFPGLRRFGRELGRSAGDLISNPNLALDAIGEGVGSLVGGAGFNSLLARGLVKTALRARGITGERAKKFLNTQRGKELQRNYATGSMPATIGAMEGGGAFIEVVSEIMEMDEAELMENSPPYQELRAQGMEHEEARSTIANQAGLEVGLKQSVVGALSGLTVARFEANPLGIGAGSKSFKSKVKDLGSTGLREGGEEATQETSSEILIGHGIQKYADETRDPYEGAGTGAGHGLVAGVGTAGTLRAPGVALSGAGEVAKSTGRAAKKAIDGRVQRVKKEIDNQSAVGANATETALNTVKENLATVSEALKEPEAEPVEAKAQAEAPTEAPQTPTPQRPLQARMEEAHSLTGDEINRIPEQVRNHLTQGEEVPADTSVIRADVINSVRQMLEDGKIPEKDQPATALWLHEQESRFESLWSEDFSQFPEQIQKAMQETQQALETVFENKTLKDMLDRARKVTAKDLDPAPEITVQNAETPEVKKAVAETVTLAEVNPANVDPKFANQILNHRRSNPDYLNDTQAKILKAAADAATLADQAAKAKAQIEQTAAKTIRAQKGGEKVATPKTIDIVRQEILKNGRDNDRGQYGLTTHLGLIAISISRGKIDEAQIYLDNLRNFGTHMQNKVAAYAESAALNRNYDNKVYFQVWNGSEFLPKGDSTTKPVWIAPKSPASLLLGREASVDAQTVTDLYNSLLETYGDELTGEKLPPVNIPELLRTPKSEARQEIPSVRNHKRPPAEVRKAENLKKKQEKKAEEARKARIAAQQKAKKEAEEKAQAQKQAEQEAKQKAEQEAQAKAEAAAQAEAKAKAEAEKKAKETKEEEITQQETVEEAPVESSGEIIRDPEEGTPEPTTEKEAPKAPDFSNLARVRAEGSNNPKTGYNRFLGSYDIDTNRSDLLTHENPGRTALDLLDNLDSEEVTSKLGYTPNEEQAKLLRDLVARVSAHLVNQMNKRLADPKPTLSAGTKAKGNRRHISPLEAVSEQAERPYLLYDAGGSLNFVDPATGKYDPRLLQSAALAAIHWSLHYIPDTTNDESRDNRFGINGAVAAESLGRTILEFWGARPNRKAELADTQGVIGAFAAELLTVMNGVLTTEHQTPIQVVTEKGKLINTTHTTVEIGNARFSEQIRNIGGMKALLGDLLLPEPPRNYHVGTPPSKVPQTRKRNRLARLGAKVRRAISRSQKVASYRSEAMSLFQAMDREFFLELHGHQPVPDKMNINHKRSVEGKNLAVERTYDELMALDDLVRATADKEGKSSTEIGVYYDWEQISNSRMMAQGYNPQADKSLRAAYTPTITTLDLSDQEARDAFWFTIGQTADLVKTEYVNLYDGALEAETKIGEAYPESIEMLREWLRNGEGKLTADQQATLKTELEANGMIDNDTSQRLHALVAVARYREAEAQGGEAWTKFRHTVSLEADGKTDGPIASLMHFLTGAFKQEHLDDLGRGGVYIASGHKTLKEYAEGRGYSGGFKDLYQWTADLLKTGYHRRKQEIESGSENTKELSDAFARLMTRFGEEFSFDPKSKALDIGRNELKNPLTVTGYGSGADGIARKIATNIFDKIYVELSKSLQGEQDPDFQQFTRDVSILTQNVVVYNNKTKKWFHGKYAKGRDGFTNTNQKKSKVDLATHTFTELDLDFLTHNIREMYVSPMREAIDHVTGDTKPVLNDIQMAVTVQYYIYNQLFHEAVEKRLEARKNRDVPGEQPTRTLSQEDYDAIYEELAAQGVVITDVATEEHYNELARAERAETSSRIFSSLDGNYQGKASIPIPSDPGVRVLSAMTISRGDAQSMINFYANESFPDGDVLRTLQVYDGLYMPADAIDRISEMINQANTEAYLDNPVKDFTENFRDWLRHLGEKRKDHYHYVPTMFESPHGDLDQLLNSLQNHSNSIEARKNAIKRAGLSNSHFAGGETAYVLEGSVDFASLDDLNKFYWEELEKIEKAQKTANSPRRIQVEKPKKWVQHHIQKLGYKVEGTEVTALTGENVIELMTKKSIGEDNRKIAELIGKSTEFFTFYFGTSEELTALRDKISPHMQEADPVDLGQVDLHGRKIFITNQAGETILHEMLHAATARLTFLYYTDPNQLTRDQRAAVENLEQLMVDFDELDFSNDPPAVQAVVNELKNQIDEHWHANDEMGRARAVQEFIAWTLSNQRLIETMKKTRVRSPLQRFLRVAMRAIRRLFGIPEGQPMDMFTNITMNAVRLAEQYNVNRPKSDSRNIEADLSSVLNQTIGKASDPRIEKLMKDFDHKVRNHLTNLSTSIYNTENERILAGVQANQESIEIYAAADRALNMASAAGFTLDPQQQSAFRSVQAAFATSMQLEGTALTRVQTLLDQAIEHIDHAPFKALVDSYGDRNQNNPKKSKNSLLASFLALSQVDPDFRKELGELSLKKGKKLKDLKGESFDDTLYNTADELLERLGKIASGEGRDNTTSLQSLDQLAQTLARIEADDHSTLEREAGRILGMGDQYGAKFISNVGEKITNFADKRIAERRARGEKEDQGYVERGLSLLAGVLDDKKGDTIAQTVKGFLSTAELVPQTLKDVVYEVIGMEDGNKAILKMINHVQYRAQRLTRSYRENVPKFLAEQFSRPLEDKEWTASFWGIGKTDLAALGESMSVQQIRGLLSNPNTQTQEIARLEKKLQQGAPAAYREYMRKAEELAEFMMTGNVAENLLMNATSIAHLNGEGQRAVNPTAEVIQTIDELTSLYAFRKLDQESKDILGQLARDEEKGMDGLLYYISSLRARENRSAENRDMVLMNGMKGFIPSEAARGSRLMVEPDSEHNRLVSLGYTRIGDYVGSGTETGKRGYYYSATAGHATFHQGIMQSTEAMVQGVNPSSGTSMAGVTAGRIERDQVRITRHRLRTQKLPNDGNPLIPIYNPKGMAVGYQRSMDPDMLAKLNRNTHFGEMLGAWAARQAEIEFGHSVNAVLVDRVHDMWVEGKKNGEEKRFINLADPDLKDPVHKAAWERVPQSTKHYISEKFGDEGFPVRDDLVDNALGYPGVSIGDAWTEVSRLSESKQNMIREAMTAVLGKNAFPWLTRAERFWKDGVSVAKNTIIVRSVIVPVANMNSSIAQLMGLGVSVRDINRGFRNKLVEVEHYQKTMDELSKLKVRLTQYEEGSAPYNRIQARMDSLMETNKRLSIWPLIEAGELSVAMEGMSDLDIAIYKGKWADWMRDNIDIPEKIQGGVRQIMMNRDTAIFQGMAKAVLYGDFLAKAVLYDHLTKKEKLSPEEAMERVWDEFVPYNLLPGRVRSMGDSMGLTWFWAYKIRSMKVALRTMRKNPVRGILAAVAASYLLPALVGLNSGTALTDNMGAVMADGRFGYSVGPGMLFNAPGLHPVLGQV